MTLSVMIARPTGRNLVRADRFGGQCKAFLCRGGTRQGKDDPEAVALRSCGRRDKSRAGILVPNANL